jgi:hypothetical protein
MSKIVLLVLAIALVVFLPFASIWAVNTLFPALAIPSNFDTWCAVVVLGMFFRGEANFKA